MRQKTKDKLSITKKRNRKVNQQKLKNVKKIRSIHKS